MASASVQEKLYFSLPVWMCQFTKRQSAQQEGF